MSNLTTIIVGIQNNISNLDYVSENLPKVPVEQLPNYIWRKLFAILITSANGQDSQICQFICQYFSMKLFDDMRVDMFANPYLSDGDLSFIIKCYPNRSALTYYVDVINMRDEMLALQMMGRMEKYLPTLTSEEWEELVRIATPDDGVEDENAMLREYFTSKAIERKNKGDRPSWVYEGPAPVITPYSSDILPVQEAVTAIITHAQDQQELSTELSKEQLDLIRNTLIVSYSLATSLERINMVPKPMPEYDDLPLFREFGPVNSMYSFHQDLFDKEHECTKYGGCRMLLCKEFEVRNQDGELLDLMCEDNNIDSWFRKSCDFCGKYIAKACHAVRMPLFHGGWRGCYCSFNCINEDQPEMSNEQRTSLLIVEKQLRQLGLREQ